jgi:hypothetical protein
MNLWAMTRYTLRVAPATGLLVTVAMGVRYMFLRKDHSVRTVTAPSLTGSKEDPRP